MFSTTSSGTETDRPIPGGTTVSPTHHPLPQHVIALTPSRGRGGGIETYTRSVLEAIGELGIKVTELPYINSDSKAGPVAQARYLARCVREARHLSPQVADVLCFHPGLVPVALTARQVLRSTHQVRVFFYGTDILSATLLERRFRRLKSIRAVTISSFSAGALADLGSVAVLPPAVPRAIFTSLIAIPRPQYLPELNQDHHPIRALSVFRLGDFEYKGGPELLLAVEHARRAGRDISLTIAGTGAILDRYVKQFVRYADWLRIVPSPSPEELSQCYAEADVFVLATRQRGAPSPAGEGFGIVLIEAALAGLPVVAPAGGGSREALLPNITGVVAPAEDVETLVRTLAWCYDSPRELKRMGKSGREWATREFAPERYLDKVRSVLWSGFSAPAIPLEVVPTHPGGQDKMQVSVD